MFLLASHTSSPPGSTSTARGSWTGWANVIHERLFAVELTEGAAPGLREPGILGNFTPAGCTMHSLPAVALAPEPSAGFTSTALLPFLDEVRKERLAEVERIAAHVELSLTELLQKADEEIGQAAAGGGAGVQGAEGRLAQAETRHAELLARRDRRRQELEQQRVAHPPGRGTAHERVSSCRTRSGKRPRSRRLQPNPETEASPCESVMEYERAQGRQVYDVHEKNLGYDLTSLDLDSGELRLIEVKGLGARIRDGAAHA